MTGKLIIKIKKDGSIESETIGIKGKSCENYIKLIEELTESKVTDIRHTREYYETSEDDNVNDVKLKNKT